MANKEDKLEDRKDQEKDATTLQNHLLSLAEISYTQKFLFAYLNLTRHGQSISWLSNLLQFGHFKQTIIKDTQKHIMKRCPDNN